MQEISAMTDRELLEELVSKTRALESALEALTENPMVNALMSGASPMEAMMAGRG
jgi:hypothetical protein